jgi:hypothetical protein
MTAALSPSSLIEPYAERRERRAAERKISIAREAAALAATYRAVGLDVPLALLPKPEPAPEPVFIPYRVKRTHGRTGRPCGRPPSAARAAALAAGRRTYQGRPCRHGHPGLRYCKQSVCVRCAELRREARNSTIWPEKGQKAINHSAPGRVQPSELARGRLRPGRGHSHTSARRRAPRAS